jgi:hypothetical protein
MKKSFQKLIGVAIMIAIAFVITIQQPDNIFAGEKLATHSYVNSFNFSLGLDTTAARNVDTFTVIATGYGPPFFFTDLGGYSSLTGYLTISVTNVDTGSSAADFPDTTKDTVEYLIYTSCNSGRDPSHIIEKGFIRKSNAAGISPAWFSIPSDSAICENVYFAFIGTVSDSDYSCARVGAKIDYTATVHMVAKP